MSTNYLIFVRRRGEKLDCAAIEHSESRAMGVVKRLFGEHSSDRNFVSVRVEEWKLGAELPTQMTELDRTDLGKL